MGTTNRRKYHGRLKRRATPTLVSEREFLTPDFRKQQTTLARETTAIQRLDSGSVEDVAASKLLDAYQTIDASRYRTVDKFAAAAETAARKALPKRLQREPARTSVDKGFRIASSALNAARQAINSKTK